MISLLMRARDAKHVAVYTIHEQPNPPADRIDRAEALVFIPDAFSWGAAGMAPFWLASHQLWLALGAYVAVVAALAAGLAALGVNEAWTLAAIVAINVWVGFEAHNIRRQALEASGWREAGSVSGRNLAECERRFFDHWLTGQPILSRRDAEGSEPSTLGLPPASAPAAKVSAQGLLGRLFSAGA